MRRFRGYDVRNTIVLYQNGVFRSYKSWITGWHRLLKEFGNCTFIMNEQGEPETEVTWDSISVLPEVAGEKVCQAT